MRATPNIIEFADSDALATALADEVAAKLSQALAMRGHACLAVSGGSTPVAFFRALSGKKLHWQSVTVTLVDERCVGPSHERSNLRLARENLLRGPAVDAGIVPLYPGGGMDPEEAAHLADVEIADLLPLDVCILGMGTDGHTASFFPGGDNLAEAINPQTKRRVVTMQAPGAGEPRLTITLPVIASARFVALHIEGSSKRQALDKALQDGPVAQMPVRAVCDAMGSNMPIYWAA